uniref:Uncharacterized protein n=1 Tax=Anguilla anguilla TaxID=7936 RepID=A0A0E9W925_ANGAN
MSEEYFSVSTELYWLVFLRALLRQDVEMQETEPVATRENRPVTSRAGSTHLTL